MNGVGDCRLYTINKTFAPLAVTVWTGFLQCALLMCVVDMCLLFVSHIISRALEMGEMIDTMMHRDALLNDAGKSNRLLTLSSADCPIWSPLRRMSAPFLHSRSAVREKRKYPLPAQTAVVELHCSVFST